MVSVILPTYNRAFCIEKSICSVLKQTYENFELLIIDDGSEDDTEKIVKPYLNDSRISFYKLDKNRGVANARNYGAGLCRGEWIAFEDSDDVWRLEKITEQMEYVKSNQKADLIYCMYEYHPAESNTTFNVPGDTVEDTFENLFMKNRIGAPTVLVKKTFFDSLRGFDVNFPALEDWDFALKASISGKIVFCPKPLMDVYQTKGGLSESSKNYYIGRSKLITKYKSELEKRNMFDSAVMDYFNAATRDGNLELAKLTLMKELMSSRG